MSSFGSKAPAVPEAPPTPPKPENIFYILLPTEWKNKLKSFNKNVSHLKFVKSSETPAILKGPFTFLDNFFNCTGRGSSVGVEIFAGVINFFSCMYILAAIPVFMASAGYNSDNALAIISLGCGLGNILSGIVSNLPIIISPPVPISIYFSSTLLQNGLTTHQGNMAVFYSGIFFLIMAVVAPIGRFMARIIPDYIQLSTTIGIGLFTVLYGFYDLGIVTQGKYTLLELGNIDSQVVIGISAIIVTAWGIIAKSKISLLAGLVWGTVLWWSSQRIWPDVWTSIPTFVHDKVTSENNSSVISLVFELFILNLITCFGLCTALCKLGEIITKEGMVPNGRFLSIIVGLCNIFSGMLYGPPFVVSPESSAGIKAGGKTGLSTVVAGIFFLFTLFFGPFFSSIPPAGTSPILVMTGLLLVKNVQNIDFLSKFAVPAYLCLTLIPFTNSIFAGIGVGTACYLVISIVSGHFVVDARIFLHYYFPDAVSSEAEDLLGKKVDDNMSVIESSDSTSSNGVSPIHAIELSNADDKSLAADTKHVELNVVTANPGGEPGQKERVRRPSLFGIDTSFHLSDESGVIPSPIQAVRTFARRQSISIVTSLADSEIGGGADSAGFMLNP